MALVGNKADLHEKREVAVQVVQQPYLVNKAMSCIPYIALFFVHVKDGMDYSEKNGMFFIETSAKTADNINELFEVPLIFAFCQLFS